MFRFLPRPLRLAYRAWIEARSYARSTRIRPIAEAQPSAPSGSDRLHRLNIVQDARCEYRPPPRKLFRNPAVRRDTTSWCDRPNAWTGRRKPRCQRCERAYQAYRAACQGDWKAECWLYREARLSAVRLAIECNQYRDERRIVLALRREARERDGPGPPPLGLAMYLDAGAGSRRCGIGHWHVIERREVEAALLRAHAIHLRRETQKRRERLREHELARERPAAPSHASHAPDAEPAPTPPDAHPAPARLRIAALPPDKDTGIRIGAGRWTIPTPRERCARAPDRLHTDRVPDASSLPERGQAMKRPAYARTGSSARMVACTAASLFALMAAAGARPPESRIAELRAGIAVTNWFRFPPRADADSLRAYLSDSALADLRADGFTHVRLPVQPELLWQNGAIDPSRVVSVIKAVQRINSARLAVVVALAPSTWRLEASAPDRLRLLATWRALAAALAYLDQSQVFPEILNEPVFGDDEHAWAALQAETLAAIREALPDATVVLTGAQWGGVEGLRALTPVPDPNVVYSFHFYEPTELTALAAYRNDLDRAALSRLPFPTDPARCRSAVQAMSSATRDVAAFYCASGWDAAHIGARFDQVVAWAQSCGGSGPPCAVLLGEFGATVQLPAPTRLSWIEAVRAAAEARGFGWTLWGYDDVMGCNIGRPPPLRPRLDPALLVALGLPTAASRHAAR